MFGIHERDEEHVYEYDHHTGTGQSWGQIASDIWSGEKETLSRIIHGKADMVETGIAVAEVGAVVALGATAVALALPEAAVVAGVALAADSVAGAGLIAGCIGVGTAEYGLYTK
jgi:hypothetical protein